MNRKLFRAVGGVAAVLGVTAMVSALGAKPADAGGRCRRVFGKVTIQTVTGPTCNSVIGLCATGAFSGGIQGRLDFVGTSSIATVDTPATSVVLVTGDNVIHTARGDLFVKDAILLKTTGAGEISEVDTIVGGTGSLTGYSGTLTAAGTFTAANGGEALYTAELCAP